MCLKGQETIKPTVKSAAWVPEARKKAQAVIRKD
jgi:hypothetical protein